MRRPLIGVIAAAGMLLAGTMVFAQGVITEIKTPPSVASDTYSLPLAIHPAGQPPWAGWAGARMKVHILDAGEMDILSIGPTPGMGGAVVTNPFGPASMNSQSVPKFFTAVHPLAQGSGINVTPSNNLPIFNVTVHVKNSDPAGNSDVDATFMFWNIWHIRDNPTAGSTLVRLEPSAFVWVTSFFQDQNQFQHTAGSAFLFPTNPATINNPDAHWLHIFEPITFHLVGGPGSQFYATFLNTATLGIEHVPEPAGVALLTAGAASALLGVWFRRRRRKLAA